MRSSVVAVKTDYNPTYRLYCSYDDRLAAYSTSLASHDAVVLRHYARLLL